MIFGRAAVRSHLAAVLFFSLLTNAWADLPSYSLDALYRMALDYSDEVKLARESVYVAEQDKKRALSVLIPRFSAFGEYLHYSEARYLDDTPIQPEWSSSYGIRLDQSFTLNGKELIALEISKDTIAKKRLDLAADREVLLLQVAQAYYDLLKTEKAVEIAVANVNRLTTYRDAVKTRLKLGAVTKTDLYRAEAELSGAVTDSIRAENLRILAQSVVARLTGVTGAFQLDPADTEAAADTAYNLTELKQAAYRHRSDLNALRVIHTVASNQVRFTKSAWWPRIGIEGVWARPDASPEALAPVEDRFWAGVNLQFSLYDGGLRKAELNQSRSQKRQAELGMAALKKQIALEVDEAYLNYITRQNTIAALEDQLTFARENHRAILRQFEFGLANSIDVADANTLLVTAERRLAEAVFESRLARLKIEQSTGQLLTNVSRRLDLND